jgi:hypothetical protein
MSVGVVFGFVSDLKPAAVEALIYRVAFRKSDYMLYTNYSPFPE